MLSPLTFSSISFVARWVSLSWTVILSSESDVSEDEGVEEEVPFEDEPEEEDDDDDDDESEEEDDPDDDDDPEEDEESEESEDDELSLSLSFSAWASCWAAICAANSFGAFFKCSLMPSVNPPNPMEVKKFIENLVLRALSVGNKPLKISCMYTSLNLSFNVFIPNCSDSS